MVPGRLSLVSIHVGSDNVNAKPSSSHCGTRAGASFRIHAPPKICRARREVKEEMVHLIFNINPFVKADNRNLISISTHKAESVTQKAQRELILLKPHWLMTTITLCYTLVLVAKPPNVSFLPSKLALLSSLLNHEGTLTTEYSATPSTMTVNSRLFTILFSMKFDSNSCRLG